jgi:hypothetical protein
MVSQDKFAYMKAQSQLFSTEAAVTSIVVIFFIIFDRIVHRTDTKPVTTEKDGEFKKVDKNFGK